jgi:hypothetical protein
MAEETTEKTTEKKEELKQCPRCGWSTKEVPEPNKEDVKEFMRCMLGMRPFVKVYPYWEGAGKCTFTTLNSDDTDNVNRCILNCGKVNELDIRLFSHKVKLLYILSSMEVNKVKTEFVKPDLSEVPDESLATAVEAEFKKRFGAFPDPVLQIVVRSMLLFSDLQNMLTGAALDENFWKAAGPY